MRLRLIPKPGLAAEDRGALRWLWSGGEVGEVGAECGVDLAGDVALEAAHDLALTLAFAGAACGVGLSALAVAQSADSDEVQRAVGLAVPAGVEAMACDLA